ncbi:MAG: hypothetical protein ABJB73_07165 [Candidatus Nitrosocosmicus sp.]
MTCHVQDNSKFSTTWQNSDIPEFPKVVVTGESKKPMTIRPDYNYFIQD